MGILRDSVQRSQVSSENLEVITLGAARTLDGRAIEFLDGLTLDPEMRLSVQEKLGYERITRYRTFEDGKALLQRVSAQGRQLDYERILGPVYLSIREPTLFKIKGNLGRNLDASELYHAINIAHFVKELGHDLDLDNLWISRNEGDCLGPYFVVSREPKVQYRRKFGIGSPRPIFEPIKVDGYSILREQIITAMEKGLTHGLSDEKLIDMLNKANQIGLAINPEDVAKLGYKRLKRYELDYGTRLLRIAQALGASVEPTVLSIANKYQELKPQQQTKE